MQGKSEPRPGWTQTQGQVATNPGRHDRRHGASFGGAAKRDTGLALRPVKPLGNGGAVGRTSGQCK